MSVTQERPRNNPTTTIAAVKMLVGSSTAPRLAMQGTSMFPLLREPMVLELAPLGQEYRVGDVVVFESDNKLVAHRITRIRRGLIETCGDARPWSPEYPKSQTIIGKVNVVYADERPGSPRIDTRLFYLRGALYARTRGARALLFRPVVFTRRFARALPWRRQRSYGALVEAMAAVVQKDCGRFQEALARVPPGALIAVARRHGCAAALVEAIFACGTTGETAAYARRAMQPIGRSVVLSSLALKSQINSVATALASQGVSFALLKGAARLYRDEPNAMLHGSSDIDILVPQASLEAAIAALRAQGYDERRYALMRERYRARHHHAAPLFPPGRGFAIELHRSLAPPGNLSTALDWDALRGFMTAVPGPAGPVLCLNNVGAALHLAVHSIGQLRLRDSVLLALLLTKMSGHDLATLQNLVAGERADPIRLSGSLALAAHIAGIEWPSDPDVDRYLSWSSRREDVPLYFSQRSPLAEGWYAAGRRFTPLVWRLLDPRHGLEHEPEARSVWRVIGRAITSTVALAYTRTMGGSP